MNKLLQKLNTTFKTVVVLSILSSSVCTYADDTEVFYSVNVSKPNLMFVLDVSGSMGNTLTGSGETAIVEKSISHVSADSQQSLSVTTTQGNGNNGNGNGGGSGGGTVITVGANSLNDNSIEIGDGSISRFRFKDLGIPEGSTITEAYIQFEAGVPANPVENIAAAKFYIYTQRIDDAPLVENDGFNIYGSIEWEPAAGWAQGDKGNAQKTPDISNLIKSVVDRNGWGNTGNNGLAVYISALKIEDPDETVLPGKRWVNSFDNVSNNNVGVAPVLYVEYSEGDKSKIVVMQETLRKVLEDSPDNVQVGLMNYGQEGDSSSGEEHKRHYAVSGVAFPSTDINAKARDVIPTADDVHGLPNYPGESVTVREYIADIADSWSATNYTPIVDSLYEAALYMRGEKVHYGQTLPNKNGAHPSTYLGDPVRTDMGTEITTDMEVSGRDRSTTPTYRTPINSSCQENYIVLMTDGAPTYNISNDGLSTEDTKGPLARRASLSVANQGPQGALASALPTCASPAGVGDAGTCGAELTHYLANNDNLPDPTANFPDGQEGVQPIHTFAIGFGTGTNTNTYLKSLATYNNPDTAAGPEVDGYFEATTPKALADAFKEILEEVAAPKGTLASPGYSVNVKNGLEHEKDIYIPVFDRKNTSRWSGNLKKFKIVDVDGRRVIQGSNDVNATDELGNFTSNAIDYWSNATNANPDGRSVEKGGLANKLTAPDARKIYSNLSGNTNVSFSPTDTTNRLTVANIENNNITNSDLGLPILATEDYRKTILNFMLGWKNGDSTSADKEARFHMGDMLHSEPIVITYDKGTSDADKEQYIFAGTNEGYLHAFDTNTGEEKFAFIPAELLAELSEHQFLNSGTQADHKYGVDGVITADFKGGEDGKLDVANGDKIILYFGLRRGGNSFYALDVTDIDAPKLLWKRSKPEIIVLPTALDSMGQSWSTPYIAKVGMTSDSIATAAVLVSGGYDEDEDRDLNDGTERLDESKIGDKVPATEGDNIFIFRAGDGTNAGQLLWSMPDNMKSQITNSIPGGLRPLDTNYNGIIDRIYFADTGGNVWRIDLSEALAFPDTTSVLTKIASLGGTGPKNRMFFNEPDVTRLKLKGKDVFGIAIGSGFRAHPMDDTINDKFFYLIDDSPYKPLVKTGDDAYTAIEVNDLSEINVSSSSVTTTGSITDTGSRGWIIDLLDDGEKVLGTSIAVDGNILFTTLVPKVFTNNPDQCAAPITQSRLYGFNVITGKPGMDLDLDGTIDDNDAFIMTGTEILGKPQIVFNTPEYPAVLDDDGNDTGETGCTHPVDIRTGKKSSQATGYEACRLESVYWSDPANEKQ